MKSGHLVTVMPTWLQSLDGDILATAAASNLMCVPLYFRFKHKTCAGQEKMTWLIGKLHEPLVFIPLLFVY